jgi:hypothetical protein
MGLVTAKINDDYQRELSKRQAIPSRAGLPNAAPVIYFPGALFYSVGFNVNQNFKKKVFLNNSMFQLFFVALP